MEGGGEAVPASSSLLFSFSINLLTDNYFSLEKSGLCLSSSLFTLGGAEENWG